MIHIGKDQYIQLPLGYSVEEKRNIYGVSLCGKVAREIAAFLGRQVPQGENNRLLDDYCTKNHGYIGEFSVENIPNNAYMLDIFLTSNTKLGRQFGHRTIAENIRGKWLVYDPFLGNQTLSLSDFLVEYEKVRCGKIVKIHAYK